MTEEKVVAYTSPADTARSGVFSPYIEGKATSFLGLHDVLSTLLAHAQEVIPDRLMTKYRIEISMENGTPSHVRLRTDIKATFDWLLRQVSDEKRQQFLTSADEYLARFMEDSQSDPRQPEDPQPNPYPRVCKHGTSCRHQSCSNGEHILSCQRKERRRSGRRDVCDFRISDNIKIDLVPAKFFTVVRRKEATRDLLIMPCPFNDNNEQGPHNNIDLIHCESVWNYVEAVVGKISELCGPNVVELLALNFGDWESAANEDKDVLQCHGHIHVQVSRSGCLTLGQRYPNFQGCLSPCYDHHARDCETCRASRVAPLLNNIRYREVDRKLSALNNTLQMILKMLKER